MLSPSNIVLRFILFTAGALAAFGGCSGTTTVTCTAGTGATLTPPGGGWAKASQYPSSFTVAGAPGSVTAVSVTIHSIAANGTSFTCLSNTSMMLVSPDSRTYEFMHDAGSANCIGGGTNLSNLTLNIADSNATAMPGASTDWSTANGTMSVKPGSLNDGNNTVYPSPAPTVTLKATPSGTATFTSAFTGAPANGTWSLYVAGDGGGDSVSFTSWDMTLTVSASSTTTTTTIVSGTTSPAVTGTSVTYTATVSATSGTATGTVTFTDTLPGSSATALCSSVALNGSAQATCSPSIASEGNHLITATYSPSGSFGGSSAALTEVYRKATTNPSGLQFCNAGNLSFPGIPGNQPIYPSFINVTGVTNSVATLSVQMTGLNGGLSSTRMMLVSPNGQAYEFFSDAGVTAQTAVNVTFADNNTPVPQSLLSSGTYGAAAYTANDVYPAPAPSGEFIAAPGGGTGARTFETAFTGATSNGLWQLYVNDPGGTGSAGSISGGWCITLTTNTGANTATTATSGTNPSAPGQAVTYVATVSSGSTVNQGSVTFTEGGAALPGGPVGGVAVSNGTATASYSIAAEGDHTLTAAFSDGSQFNPSFGMLVQRVNHATAASVTGTNAYSYCNAGPITIPGSSSFPSNIGPASPNPSILAVRNLPGLINGVTLSLANYHTNVANAVSSLLVGPATTSAQSFDFFSNVGTNAFAFGPGNLTFSDAAASLVPQSAFGAGTYKPTSYSPPNTYTASSSGFYTLPTGPYPSASAAGTSTFATIFGGAVGTGNWGLYFNESVHETGGGVDGGWCLNFTQNPVTGTGTTSHTGPAANNHMQQGGTGSISFSLLNDGNGPTGDADQSVAHAMTVTGTLPSGLTFGTVPTGSPWNCTVTTSVTCTNLSAILQGSTYQLLTIPVNVSASAPGTVTVSGFTFGGAGMNAGTFSSDTITINPAPVLGLAKSHAGTFTQGSTATWNIQVTNNSASAAGATDGSTVTVQDVLPAGYTINSVTATNWSCSGTTTLTCTSTQVVAGSGGQFPLIAMTVNIPANSATSITNTAVAFGGGDLNHTTAANGATGSDTVTVVQVPATITLTAGNNQSAAINTAFPVALSATVKDAASVVISGLTVTFTAPSTGASGTFANNTTTTTAVTNGSGVASASTFTANATVGGPYSVSVSAGSITNNFSLTNTTGAPASMTANAGTTPQSAMINTAFTNALAVTVKDAGSNPVSGVSVTFTAPGAGASGVFSNNTATITVVTNASGVASAPFTANNTAGGPYTVTAAASGLTTVNFSLTNTAGASASMTANPGTTPQSATVNTAFTNALAVTVRDAGSNPVSGVSVTFTAPGTGASGVFSNSTATITVVTNASGVASAPFTANNTAGGPYTVAAAASGLTTVNFSLTNTAGASASMTANPGTTPQSATINTAFANALAVTVKDAGSNPVSGVSVTFTAPGAGASGVFSNSTATITVVTNASGVASAPFTANNTAGGPYTVTAAASGLTTVNFSLTNTTGASASMTANPGTTPQSATINTAFANALAVTVKDAGSNPVSGVSVTFTAPGAGASGVFSNSTATITVVTNASGVASAPFTANNTAGGPYTVTAAASGLTTVNFSLTNTTGASASMTANPGTTPQSATINTAFTNALAVTVRDAGSNPVSGVSVTFTAPGAGASGVFSNNTATITVVTNASGVASAPFTANNTAGGPYTVTAAASGLTTVNFSLTNVGNATNVTGQISYTQSGLIFNRATQTFNGTLTVTNTSGSSINGPLQLVFTGLPSGVTLSNAAGTQAGSPYITSAGGLAPGASASVAVQFKIQGGVLVNYVLQVYSGTF